MHCKGCLWFPKNSPQKPIPLGGLYAQQLGTWHAGLCLDQCILQVLSSSENLNKKWSAETYWGREVRVSGIKWNSLKFWHEFLGPRNSSNNLKYSIWNYCRVSKSGLQEFSDFKSGNGDILRVDIPRAGDFCGATKHLADCSLVEISWSQSLPSIPYFQGNLHPLVTIFVHQNEKHPEDWFFIACLFHPWISTNHNYYHKPSTPWPSAIMFHHVSSLLPTSHHPNPSQALRSPGAQTFDRYSPRRYDPTALASRWPGAGEKRTTGGWTPASPVYWLILLYKVMKSLILKDEPFSNGFLPMDMWIISRHRCQGTATSAGPCRFNKVSINICTATAIVIIPNLTGFRHFVTSFTGYHSFTGFRSADSELSKRSVHVPGARSSAFATHFHWGWGLKVRCVVSRGDLILLRAWLMNIISIYYPYLSITVKIMGL